MTDCVGFDNDQICIENACPPVGASCTIKTITSSDSVYNTTPEDIFIQVDASSGPVDINLTDNPDNPNQKYIFKRIDDTSNIVTIFPHPGGTVDSSASYNLPRVTEVVTLCRDDTNWIVTNDKLDRVLTTKGDLYTHDGDHVIRLPVGTDGQILTANSGSTGGLAWTAISSLTAKVTYMILPNRVCVMNVAYTPIAYFPWSNNEHGGYTGGKVIFRTRYQNRDLNIRLYDATNSVVLGELTAIQTSGTFSFTINIPTSDAQVELQVGTSSQGGKKPEVFGATMEFTN